MRRPTDEQIATYRRDGFLIVERFLAGDTLDLIRAHFARVFEHEWETGLAPDEVNYVPGSTAPDLTRQLCNVWKADRVLAEVVLARQVGEFAARLGGVPGVRLAQDNAIWKPPSGRALLCHQDAAYLDYLDPPNMITCWMALDDTAADTGTIYYVRGSNHWPHARLGAGGAAFHDGWTFHGSPSNKRADAQRRSIISHLISTDTRWNPKHNHQIYSRYRRPGEVEIDEAFFPVLWQDGYRTPWLTDAEPRFVSA